MDSNLVYPIIKRLLGWSSTRGIPYFWEQTPKDQWSPRQSRSQLSYQIVGFQRIFSMMWFDLVYWSIRFLHTANLDLMPSPRANSQRITHSYFIESVDRDRILNLYSCFFCSLNLMPGSISPLRETPNLSSMDIHSRIAGLLGFELHEVLMRTSSQLRPLWTVDLCETEVAPLFCHGGFNRVTNDPSPVTKKVKEKTQAWDLVEGNCSHRV